MPWAGDEVVLMGNTQNKLRQNLISIAATEDGQPRVDVLDGVSSKTFKDSLRVRLGNLDGISDDRFPLDNQPKGNGLYGDNVYLVGTFMLTTGEDILTKFNIMEGKIESSIEGLRTDFATDKGYLGNPTFDNGLEKWNTENEATFFMLGNRWIWANSAPLSNKTNYACVRTEDGRKCVFIRDKYILQKNADFRSIPEFAETNSDGEKKAEAVYLSFFYKCTKGGRLTIDFDGVDKTGFENFNTFSVDEEISETEGFVVFNRDGLWNGTGDFKLTFTGEIYLYMLILSTDRVNALAYKYKTLFEQSERLIKISAAVFDKDEKMLEETGLMVTSQMAGLYAIDGDGNLKSFVGASQEGVKIKATNIIFEGLVTANEYFKILEDGSIEANNANIKNGKIGGFVLASGRIGAETTSDGAGGGLAIYDDFFRVGGNKGYVMFGNDVIPASAGGAFTAVGRIVNNAPNTYGSYGFDQANYGLFISVSGGTKNYGISSDAVLKAPAFINTKAQCLTFGGGTYKIDFSQSTIFLLSASTRSSVTLPTEASVASMFSLSSLPNDFGAVVLFKIIGGSSNIILNDVYNANEGLTNHEMAQGDSCMLLITKADGFRYNILNIQN